MDLADSVTELPPAATGPALLIAPPFVFKRQIECVLGLLGRSTQRLPTLKAKIGVVFGLGLALLGAAAAAQPAPGTPLPFAMPPLNDPGVRRNFESRVSELCRSAFKIEEIAAANGTSRDTFVCQTPPPQAPFGCRARVRVYVSNGMPLQPPSDEGTGTRTPEPCSEPVEDGLTPPGAATSPGTGSAPTTTGSSPTDHGAQPPQGTTTPTGDGVPPGDDTGGPGKAQPATTWPMADLSLPDGEARLEADTQRYCRRGAAMQESLIESALPEGALVRQSPQPRTPINCVTPILVSRSIGPSCRATSPLSFQRLFVGDRCGAPIVPGRTLAFGVVGLVVVGLAIGLLWPRPPIRPKPPKRPEPPKSAPATYVVAGTPHLTSRPDASGLRRAGPDIELERAEASVVTTAQSPLGIHTVEISNG